MPDISLCVNKKCPLKASCYRFRAVPSSIQSYTCFEPTEGKCEHFLKIGSKKVEPMPPEQLDLYES